MAFILYLNIFTTPNLCFQAPITAMFNPAIREYYPEKIPAKEPLRIPHSLAECVIISGIRHLCECLKNQIARTKGKVSGVSVSVIKNFK